MNALARFKYGVLALSLLIAAVVWTPFADAAPKNKPPKSSDISDLNDDGNVDYTDLVIFSSNYLGQNVETMDWCAFLDATTLEGDLYGRPPDYYINSFGDLLTFMRSNFDCAERSDLNNDSIINARDLMLFSERFAGEHFLRVDWCEFLQSILEGGPHFGNPADFYLEHYGNLVLFIQEKYTCTDEPPPPVTMELKNNPKFLTRIAASRNLTGDYYVTDARVGSIFIYDSNLVLSREIKGLAKPLGIAVDSTGNILVGSDKRNSVEVYDPQTGEKLATFGETELEMPVAITVASNDWVYVTDSRSNTVYVYDSNYQLVTNIGEPGVMDHQLRSPSDAVLSTNEDELLVLDRLNRLIKVFSLGGVYLRSILPDPGSCGMMGCSGGTPFTRLQAACLAADGNLHALDIFDVLIAVFDPQSGSYVAKYGEYGPAEGQLRSPMDLLVEPDRVLVVDGGKNTIEVLAIP